MSIVMRISVRANSGAECEKVLRHFCEEVMGEPRPNENITYRDGLEDDAAVVRCEVLEFEDAKKGGGG